jgi:transketolase
VQKRELEQMARLIRRDIVKMVHEAGSGHPGGSLSAVELVTVLYFSEMNVDPQNPKWADRDRFILSKGHACPVWYAALARKGFFPLEQLGTLRKLNSILQGHPDMNKTPGVDMTSGSLGQGLSAGFGMALGAKVTGKAFRVYVLLGDGELQEGSIWESAMAAAKYKLDNLVAIVDCNGLQVDGQCSDVMDLEPLADKWRAFKWAVRRIDGHDLDQILDAFAWARQQDGPVAILAETVKGKGVSFMENAVHWHGLAPNREELEAALAEIG